MKRTMISLFLVGMLSVSTVGFAQNKEAAKQQKAAIKVEKKNQQAAEGKGHKKTAHLKKAAVKSASSSKVKENKKK